MHNTKANFDQIFGGLKDILGEEINENYLRPRSVPKFFGIEVIAISLTSECLGIVRSSHF